MATTVLVTNLPEVQRFYGDSHEIDTFIREIRDFWDAQPNLDAKRKFNSILNKVSDSVRAEIDLNKEEIAEDPVKALRHLQNIYHDPRPARRLMASFLQMEQRSGETVREFGNRLYKAFSALRKKQSSEGTSKSDDYVLKEQFLAAVASEPLRHRLAEMLHDKPDTSFSQLRDAAMRWEGRATPGTAVAAVTTDTLAPIAEVVRTLGDKFGLPGCCHSRKSDCAPQTSAPSSFSASNAPIPLLRSPFSLPRPSSSTAPAATCEATSPVYSSHQKDGSPASASHASAGEVL